MDRGGEGEVVGLVARGNDGALAGDLRLHLGITRVGQPELQGLEPLRPQRGAAAGGALARGRRGSAGHEVLRDMSHNRVRRRRQGHTAGK